jgi:hypothetical protein
MTDEVSTISEIKTTSDGTVTISVEKYNELLETAAANPPVINRTTVIKTEEMIAKEFRVWGGSLMGLGASMFALGAFLFKKGLS